mmetsp:Transcript_22778/g.71371  ORF Transcript_22778/g.71371 Transcript_22778/m.71371 type:complete len:248 (+) Transcript_22778:309-1052(+)
MDLSELFVNREYSERRFEFGDGHEDLVLCSESACTDHDLTGQVVWPVSVLLASFAARQDWRGLRVVELGAGCGLPGLVAARRGARVALTDGSAVCLDLLRQSVEAFGSTAAVAELVWGDRASADAFAAAHGAADVVLGADVVAWPQSVEPLFQTLNRIAAKHASFYCGFVVRAYATRDLFYAVAERYGFTVVRVDPATFLPDDPPDPVKHSRLPLHLLRLDRAPAASPPDAFLSDDPVAFERTQTAC